jgi:UDP-glucuronate decarboxylase
MVGSDCTIRHLPLPADDPKQRQPDASIAKLILDWDASTDLETGLASTIGYFRGIPSK